MNAIRNAPLKALPEFKLLSPAISKEEYDALEKKMVASKKPIVIKVWENIILFEFDQYEICLKNGLNIRLERLNFNIQEEALLWVCRYKLNHTKPCAQMYRYLLGKISKLERICGKKKQIQSTDTPINSYTLKYYYKAAYVHKQVGEEFGKAASTIAKYELYANSIDKIHSSIPDIAYDILNGIIKVDLSTSIYLANLDGNELSKLTKGEPIRTKNNRIMQFSKNSITKSYSENAEGIGSIKKMPEYDPDAEITSLSLTIPSWRSSIQRITSIDLSQSSSRSKEDLCNELYDLDDAIYTLLRYIEEIK